MSDAPKFEGALPSAVPVNFAWPFRRFDVPCWPREYYDDYDTRQIVQDICTEFVIDFTSPAIFDSKDIISFSNGRTLTMWPDYYRCCEVLIHQRTLETLLQDGSLQRDALAGKATQRTGFFTKEITYMQRTHVLPSNMIGIEDSFRNL